MRVRDAEERVNQNHDHQRSNGYVGTMQLLIGNGFKANKMLKYIWSRAAGLQIAFEHGKEDMARFKTAS